MSMALEIDAYPDDGQPYHRTLNILNIIALTVLLLDHLLTFADEVKYVWNKKMTPFSVLFLANRYLASVTMTCYVVGVFLPYSIQDRISNKFQPGVISMVQTCPTIMIAEAILVLRVYVVYKRNKSVLALLSLVYVAHVGVAISIIVAHEVRLVDLLTISYSRNLRLGLSFFLPAVLFDAIVAGFLTIGLYKRSRCLISHMPLARLIIRDGSLYFLAVFGSNILWIIIGLFLDPKSGSMGFGPMYTLSSAVTTTMIGRLTLSLKAYQAEEGDELTFGSMSLRFVRSNPPEVISHHKSLIRMVHYFRCLVR